MEFSGVDETDCRSHKSRGFTSNVNQSLACSLLGEYSVESLKPAITNFCGNFSSDDSNSVSAYHILPLNVTAGVADDADGQSLPPDNSSEAVSLQLDEVIGPPRNLETTCEVGLNARPRKKRRPFSPELVRSNSKRSNKTKDNKISPCRKARIAASESPPKSFTCDNCGSSNIVNPSRRRLPLSQVKKVQTVRKKLEPISKKVLNLCNACGLAYSRPPKKGKGVTVSVQDRDKYVAEAAAFAKSLAQRIGKPAAERLYCPSYKNRPCACIQLYLSSQGGEDESNTLENRVESLLRLFNTACHLSRRKNLSLEFEVVKDTKKNDKSTSVEKKQKQRDYEVFILETRQFLRENLRLCERACQRILLYSNNFLHKRQKSSSDQSSRASRQLGKNSTSNLKPIDELKSISCCSDHCSRLASTHSTLLEEWRRHAALGQKQARRVLAEMLTPSGGTKGNCYKFISMVTGCGPTTISSVSHQMRITKGDREPPEHGLKKWFRENPRKQLKSMATERVNQNKVVEELSPLSSRLTPKAQHVQYAKGTEKVDPRILLEQQRKQLEEARHQLLLKQQELDRCQQIIEQHIQQKAVPLDRSETEVWKANSLNTSSVDTVGSRLITLAGGTGGNVMADLSREQSVQVIDLGPGTYIAVPSSFETSSFLSFSSNSKQNVSNICTLTNEELDVQQDLLLPSSCDVQTILAFSGEEPFGSSDPGIFVTIPAQSHDLRKNKQYNIPETSSHSHFDLSLNHTSALSFGKDCGIPVQSDVLPSCPTPVITQPTSLRVDEPLSCQDHASALTENDSGDEAHQGRDLDCVELNTAVLLPPPTSSNNPINVLDGLFE